MQATLEKARKKVPPTHTHLAPAIVCIVALLLICLYSVFAIHRLIRSNAEPTVPFTLGTAYRNVTYCNAQTLDLFVPRTAARPLPLAIFVHGGGMISGGKGYLSPVFLNPLARAGFAVASLNYRLAAPRLNFRHAPTNQFPAQIEDVKCGIRYLRAHAPRYDVNRNEIFAFGTSYGGTLVALAALTGDHSAFDVGPYPNTSSTVSAAVDLFGPTDLTRFAPPPDWQHIVLGSNPSNLVLASPVHYVTVNVPPILIVQGTADTMVPESQSVELYQRLIASGDQTQLVLVRNMGHMFAQVGSQSIDPSLSQIAKDIVRWFERNRAGVLR